MSLIDEIRELLLDSLANPCPEDEPQREPEVRAAAKTEPKKTKRPRPQKGTRP
jgi:hypothetical protein